MIEDEQRKAVKEAIVPAIMNSGVFIIAGIVICLSSYCFMFYFSDVIFYFLGCAITFVVGAGCGSQLYHESLEILVNKKIIEIVEINKEGDKI